MFILESEEQLLETFFDRDKGRVRLPRNLKFPLLVRDYFAWTDPGSTQVGLVFAERGVNKPIGLLFDRDHAEVPSPAMCEWCHSFGTSNQIGLLMLEVTSKRKVGVQLCIDLSCRSKIEENTSLTPVAAQTKMQRVVDEMSRFVRRLLL